VAGLLDPLGTFLDAGGAAGVRFIIWATTL